MFVVGSGGGGPLPRLRPYLRCSCGACRECRDNEKWDRIFEKFAVKDYDDTVRVFSSSPLHNM
jgi:hypothetical protein